MAAQSLRAREDNHRNVIVKLLLKRDAMRLGSVEYDHSNLDPFSLPQAGVFLNAKPFEIVVRLRSEASDRVSQRKRKREARGERRRRERRERGSFVQSSPFSFSQLPFQPHFTPSAIALKSTLSCALR
jgi:hypothetical protein